MEDAIATANKPYQLYTRRQLEAVKQAFFIVMDITELSNEYLLLPIPYIFGPKTSCTMSESDVGRAGERLL